MEINHGKTNETTDKPVIEDTQTERPMKITPVRTSLRNILRSAKLVYTPILSPTATKKRNTTKTRADHWVGSNPWTQKPHNRHSAFSLMAENWSAHAQSVGHSETDSPSPSIIMKQKSEPGTENKLTKKHKLQEQAEQGIARVEIPKQIEPICQFKSASKDILPNPNEERAKKKIKTEFEFGRIRGGCHSAFSKMAMENLEVQKSEKLEQNAVFVRQEAVYNKMET